MPNPYTSQAIANYNTSPPSDDGAATTANQVKWTTHKTKLTDPIKTLAEAINTELSAAFGKIFGNTFETISVNTTLGADDIGKLHVVDTGGVTVTLPPIATATTGFPLLIAHFGTGVVTIDGNSSETIINVNGVGGNTSITLSAGQAAFLTSDGVTWAATIFEGGTDRKVKTATTPITSDDTLTDDTHLASWAIQSAARYQVDAYFQVFQNSGNFKWQFVFDNAPVSGGLLWNCEDGSANKASDFVNSFWLIAQEITTMADGSTYGASLRGAFEAHATLDATLALQIAQETANSSPTNFLENSWINVTKV